VILVFIGRKSSGNGLFCSEELRDLIKPGKQYLVGIDIHFLERQLHIPGIVVIVQVLPPVVHREKVQQTYPGIPLLVLVEMFKQHGQFQELIQGSTFRRNKNNQYVEAYFSHGGKNKPSAGLCKSDK